MKISYSSPAKVILSGEHAVVYGKPAIVSAINLRLKFTVSSISQSGQDSVLAKEIVFISKKVREYLQKEKIKFFDKKFKVSIDSDIPIGCGLGSSAALSVAAVASFLEFYSGKKFDKEIFNNLAYQMEKYFHQNPSGIDNTASCFGGLIFYRKEFEFLKTVSSLNFKIPQKIEENLFLIDSGKPQETTAEMVKTVGNLHNKKPALVEEVLANIEKTAKRITISLIKEDEKFFKQNILDNEIFLELLGVVSKKTKRLLKELSNYGIGKITGAGGKKEGSGLILFYQENQKKNDFLTYLKKNNLKFIKFTPTYQGVVKER